MKPKTLTKSPPPDAAAALVAPPSSRLAHGLRDFAQAIRHIHDLNTFLEIFQVGLEKTGLCAQADFTVQAPDATNHRPTAFAPGRLSLPVESAGGIVTVAQVAPAGDKQHFSAEDLHTLAGLSEIVGAAVDVAHRVKTNEQALAALKAILSFAPVGICAFDDRGRVDAINSLARGWLALAEGDSIASAIPAGTSFEDLRKGASFHLRVSGRLLYCESRPQPDSRFAALVVTDLTPEQGRLLDALSREVYRANHLHRPLQFVLLERTHPIGALLTALPALRSIMGKAAIVGPYDAARIGIIFAESTWSGAILQLRQICGTVSAPDVRLGRAAITSFEETPESMITTALHMPETLALAVRPRILVHDEYRGVGDALRLVLGNQCEVTGSTDAGEASRLVREQHFDAVLADLNPAGGGQDLVARARERNQHVRAFYLSSTLPANLSGRQAKGGVPVFSKPFNVELVRDRILASLGSGDAKPQK